MGRRKKRITWNYFTNFEKVKINVFYPKSKKFNTNLARWSNKGLTLLYLPPYSPELNIIETLWRFMKYIWIDYSAYLSWSNMMLYIQKIFDEYGQNYRINFY